MSAAWRPIASPCIKVCVIEPASQLCTGCKRTLREIAAWGSLSEAMRNEIMAALPGRAVPGETAR